MHDQLVEPAERVNISTVRATTAAISGDLAAAEVVLSRGTMIDTVRDDLEARVMKGLV